MRHLPTRCLPGEKCPASGPARDAWQPDHDRARQANVARLPAWFALWLGLSLVVFAGSAAAAPKDDEAKALANDAVYTDYLALELDKAESKLDQALDLCRDDNCSPEVVATIYRNLAVVHGVGRQNLEEAKNYLLQALLVYPNITLDKDLSSPELEQTFEEAKQLAESAGGLAPGPEPEPVPEPAPAPVEPEPPPNVDSRGMVHSPPSEQAINTPVPIYVELQGSAHSVLVEYKPFGFQEWKIVRMRKHRDGYAVEIPCLDIGTTTGKLRYFVQAKDVSGRVVASSGTREAPHVVSIRQQLQADPPRLPGLPPAAQCQAASDCPPGFPGCPGGDVGADDGGGDGDAADQGALSQHWLTIAFQQEFASLSGTDAACGADSDYTCFYSDGQFLGQDAVLPNRDVGRIAGGLAPGTGRVLVGYDWAGLGALRLGARVGFAFGGGPQEGDGAAFVPIHAEARISYWFREANQGFLPFVLVGGGLAQVDASLGVTIRDPNDGQVLLCASGEGTECSVDAWRKLGTTFAEVGVGTVYAFSRHGGPLVELKYMSMFGETGNVLAAQIGYAVGF